MFLNQIHRTEGVVSSCQNTLRLLPEHWNKVLLGVVEVSVAFSHME